MGFQFLVISQHWNFLLTVIRSSFKSLNARASSATPEHNPIKLHTIPKNTHFILQINGTPSNDADVEIELGIGRNKQKWNEKKTRKSLRCVMCAEGLELNGGGDEKYAL